MLRLKILFKCVSPQLPKDVLGLILPLLNILDRRMISHAITNKPSLTNSDLQLCCAKYGYLDLLKWAVCDTPIHITVPEFAATHGQLHILEYTAAKCVWGNRLHVLAAQNNHIHIIKYLCDNQYRFNNIDCTVAVECGNFEMLQMIVRAGATISYYGTALAASKGRKDMLEFIISVEPNMVISTTTMFSAVGSGDIATCEYVLEFQVRPLPYMLNLAAEKGHDHVLEWAKRLEILPNSSAFASAASAGQLKILQWLHANNIPWHNDTCAQAARFHHLDSLKYAVKHGAPFDKNKCLKAVYEHNREIIDWINAQ